MKKTLTRIGIMACACILSLPVPVGAEIVEDTKEKKIESTLLITTQNEKEVTEDILVSELISENAEDNLLIEGVPQDEGTQNSDVNYKNATLTKKGKLLLNNLYYALEEAEDGSLYAVLTGVKKQKSSYSVPEKIYYEDVPYQVLKLGQEAFAGSTLKSIELPDCIESIEDMAFTGAIKLKSIKIPRQCQSIGTAAFMGCESLTKVDFNSAYCHTIGDAAFAMSGVKNIKLSIITDKIGAACFSGCQNLKSITFGANCDYVGEGAFTDCPSLETFKKSKMNKYLVIENGCIYSKNAKKLYSAALASGDVIIKDTVEEILPYSFENNDKITTVVIPGSVKEIPESCFLNCSKLESVILMKGVEKIGENSFYNCSSLESIMIPATVSEIVENPFMFCKKLSGISVTGDKAKFKVTNGMLMKKADGYIISAPMVSGTVNLPTSCKGVGAYAFAFNTKIKKLTVNEKCRVFEEGAFYGCNKLSYVYMPNRKVDLSVSEINEEGEFCGVFGDCAKSLEINLPYSSEAGAKDSIESNLKRHCDGELILTQH